MCSSDLCFAAAEKLISDMDIDKSDIGLVVFISQTPDYRMPATSILLQNKLGLSKNTAAFDLTLGCSGFVYGMVTASQFMHSGAYKKVLVVGADALTRFIDWKDRSTCILFGDGSGAVVMEASDSVESSGLLGFALHSDGDRYSNLQLRFQQEFKELGNTEKSIGIDPKHISARTHDLLEDIKVQLQYKSYPMDEIAVRFHHRLVSIHPFANGNGRHARLMADLLLEENGVSRFSWGQNSSATGDIVRQQYIAALRAADGKDYQPLFQFVRT
jgi:prophage maintenance system killer protein